MVQVTKMRLGFEAAVKSAAPTPLKSRVVRSLKRRIGVTFNKGGKRHG